MYVSPVDELVIAVALVTIDTLWRHVAFPRRILQDNRVATKDNCVGMRVHLHPAVGRLRLWYIVFLFVVSLGGRGSLIRRYVRRNHSL